MSDIELVCAGDIIVDVMCHIRKKVDADQLAPLDSIGEYFGGRGANSAVYASVFGAKASLLGYVGRDFEKLGFKSHLSGRGIDLGGVFTSGKHETPRFFCFFGDDYSRMFVYHGPRLEEKDVLIRHTADYIRAINSGHGALYATLGDPDLDRTCLTTSNAKLKAYAPGQNMAYQAKEELNENFDNTDILFINEAEEKLLRERENADMQQIADRRGIELVVMTLGSRGSAILKGGKKTVVTPCTPDAVIDTTGAGDAFAGAFMANYIKNEDALLSARLANATASFAVEKVGCQGSIPELSSVLQRARKHYGEKEILVEE